MSIAKKFYKYDLTRKDSGYNPDFEIEANGGVLSFTDTTNSSTKLQVHTSGITVPSGFALVGSCSASTTSQPL